MPAEMARPIQYHDRYSRQGLTAKLYLTNCTSPRIVRWNLKDCHERAHLLSCPGASPIHSETGHARRADRTF
jgi:hypothetical protein